MSLYTYNNLYKANNAYLKACLIKVVYVVIVYAVLSFSVLY
jgi:hypothetical protein